MCGHLVSAGFDVTAFDLDAAALARLADVGARAGGSVGECARGADILITMLPAPPQVEQVLLGDGGAIAALEPGSIAIDMSTSSTAVGARVVAAARARGVDVLDAPVAGQSIGAKAGSLAIYVGGSEAVFERARPLFEAMGDPERIFHLGGNGTGYTVKLLLNLLWFIQSVATRGGAEHRRARRSAARPASRRAGRVAGQLELPRARRPHGARRRRLRRGVSDAAGHEGPGPCRRPGARGRRAGRTDARSSSRSTAARARPTATTPARSARSGCTRTWRA